jgi:hypothetical protein
MIKPKNLDMQRVEELFDKHFKVDKAELTKGITMWTLTPERKTDKEKEVTNETV